MENAKADVIVMKQPGTKLQVSTGGPEELLSVQVWTGTENVGYDPYNHSGDTVGMAPVVTDASDDTKRG